MSQIIDGLRSRACLSANDPSPFARAEAAVLAWLLGSVQVETGPDRGGVLGWFDDEPSSRFVYGEITGYYLSFLAFLRHTETDPALLCRKATHAVEWMRRRWLTAPATRTYLTTQRTLDWRNSLSFSFDQIMMARGVHAGVALVDPTLRETLLAELYSRICAFVDADDSLLPCRVTGTDPIPDKWSTRPGPYQLKSAAALLAMGSSFPSRLQECGRRTCRHWASFTPDIISTEELHPLLYFVEGLVLAGSATEEPQMLADAQLNLERILRHVFETEADITWIRSDVLAQTLRLGCVFAGSNPIFRQQWLRDLHQLASALVQLIGADGVTYFRRSTNGQPEHPNVWSGIFAAQALRYYSWILRDVPIPLAVAEWMV